MWTWIKNHLPHIIFSLALIALTSLMIWWTVFIYRSIEEQHAAKLSLLVLRAKLAAEQLGHSASPPALGPFLSDTQLMIAEAKDADRILNMDDSTVSAKKYDHSSFIFPLLPRWKELVVFPSPESIAALDRKQASLRFMLVGEATVIGSVLLACLLFLYQYLQLEKRNSKEINMFWEKAAHEIKTPLSGIKLLLQTINKELKDEKFTPLLTLAQEKIDNLVALTENILRHSQPQLKKIKLSLQRLNLQPFLEDYFQNHLLIPPDAQIEVTAGIPNNPVIQADPGALRVILDNIIENALKFSPPPSILKVWVEEAGRYLILNIKDNGPGFDAKRRKEMFRPPKQMLVQGEDGQRRKTGSGLGLFIAFTLAKRMKGKLKATSPGPGQGAIFSLYLLKWL